MTDFSRAIAAEILKLRRTLLLRLAVGVPLAVVLLNLVVYAQQSNIPAAGQNPFVGFAQGSLMLWTLLVLPLYVALTAALAAAIEHQGDNWKHLLALPVARGSIFAAKWLAVAAVVLLSTLVLASGIFLGAELLRALKPGWREHTIPAFVVFTRAMQSFSAAAFALSIQLWVSLRWKSFVAGLALVIVAVMVLLGAVLRANGRAAFVRFYPWATPVTAIARMMESSPDRRLVATLGIAGGLLAAMAGCYDLARREF